MNIPYSSALAKGRILRLDKPLLIPGHIDPTLNLQNWIVAVHSDTVEAVWPIEARGGVF